MKYNRLGYSELEVSEICLGTMTFGQQNTEKEAHEQLNFAFSEGVNFIDVAEMYPVPPMGATQGLTESYVGSWLSKQNRDSVILATKVTGPGRKFDWIRGGPRAIDLENITLAVEASLARLQTDYIDLYQIHWPDRYVPNFGEWSYDPDKIRPTVSIETQLMALKKHVEAGKIRYIGLSNETPWGIMEFVRVAKENSLPVIVSTQNAYSLLNRSFETNLTEVSSNLNVPLLAYSPLAFGYLTGKYLSGQIDKKARLSLFPQFGGRYSKTNVKPATEAYCDLAKKYSLSPSQVALAFVNSRWFVASNIIGATTLEQLKSNIESTNIKLSADLLDDIDRVHLQFTNPAV